MTLSRPSERELLKRAKTLRGHRVYIECACHPSSYYDGHTLVRAQEHPARGWIIEVAAPDDPGMVRTFRVKDLLRLEESMS